MKYFFLIFLFFLSCKSLDKKLNTSKFLKHYFIVLDSTPRTLAFLNKNSSLGLAFNLDTLSLHKIWHSLPDKAIEFSGAVYDYRHGPNPSRRGRKLLQIPKNKEKWHINIPAKHRYYSFSRQKNQAIIKSFFTGLEGKKIHVKDIIELKGKIIHRSISIKNLHNKKIEIFLGDGWEQKSDSYSFNEGVLKIDKSGVYSFNFKTTEL